MIIFLAGATGAIGRRLAPLLVAEGWRVVGSTRSKDKVTVLRHLGVEPAIVDVFNASSLMSAVLAAEPEVIIHQLTDLPPGLDPAQMVEATNRNARIRSEGTRNLVEAGIRAGARRFVAQSIAFAYAQGPIPRLESDPLAVEAEGRAGISARGVSSLESQVMAAPFESLVLRYGRLYGPGTGFDAPQPPAPLHVDAAAKAALLAVVRGAPGIYNVAEDDGTISSEKAKRELQWSEAWRNTV
jgi:nucleoside-diphosphate-sugar epimerase